MGEGKILTRAPQENSGAEVLATGNEYLALPALFQQGLVESVNLLSEKARGLLEFRPEAGKYFLVPFCRQQDRVLQPKKWNWKQLDHWIPVVEISCPGGKMEITYLFPPEERGGVIVFGYKNEGLFAQNISLGFKGNWVGCNQTIYRSRRISGEKRIVQDSWTQTLNLEFSSGLSLGALAMKGGEGGDRIQVGGGEKTRLLQEGEGISTGREKIEFVLEQDFLVNPGEKVVWPLYLAVGADPDGAATTCIHLQRQGWKELLSKSRDWLQERKVLAGPPALERKLNYNLFFNYFYAQGRSIEKGELHLLTSRSPRYYVSGAYWPRDSLLWSLPGIIEIDRNRGKELFKLAVNRHWNEGGTHSQYITGGELYPGFEVDQLCAYFIAMERFWKLPGGKLLVGGMPINSMAKDFFRWLYAWKHEDEFLFATFLDPADDPPTYPYVTYNQVLIWRVLGFFRELARANLLGLPVSWLKRLREGIEKSIYDHAVVKTDDQREILAGTFDARGNHELYENPPGALSLLPYWDFLDIEDPLYQNTMEWINSSQNQYYLEEGKFPGISSAHADGAWVLAAVSELLSGYRAGENREWLMRAALDGGLACETVDTQTGKAKTGLAFATCAGFLGYALAIDWRRQADEQN